MNFYDVSGIKIRTKINFDSLLYKSCKNNFDFEVIHDDDFFEESYFKKADVLFRRFIINESTPFEEVFQMDNGKYLIRWLNTYFFYIDKRLVIFKGKLDSEFYSLFFSKVLSFLLYLKGYTQLHGSAARYINKTVCFIGESGSGKSTCASQAVLNGGKIITDDIIALHPVSQKLISGVPSLRLESTSSLIKMATKTFDEVDKLRIDLSHGFHYSDLSTIDCFIFLEVNDETKLSISKIKGNEKMLHLLTNVFNKFFLKNVFNHILYKENMKVFSYLTKRIPMFKVYRQSKTKPTELLNLIHSIVLKL
ncbi:hypothetical protein SAMN05444392_11644 [Seinonella peptonophila]|uniref:HPr Serine kinase C-terminal domain-containing protein n=1 Tax=Seinonella peptonophila TaxID=112248 RepID=A0A1M5AWM6_9BACL|nr:hypothetical protein [Seinonella peptonophila]SHF34619.1 hypothetical protein SAMN05444392_11644 [Seinonella peptonophila]